MFTNAVENAIALLILQPLELSRKTMFPMYLYTAWLGRCIFNIDFTDFLTTRVAPRFPATCISDLLTWQCL